MKIAIHLGLGDAIVCAPIIAKYAQENEVIEIPCWKHNEVSVKSFFINYPNVKVIPLIKVFEFPFMDSCDLKLGHYNSDLPQLPNEDFVQWFYRQANFDINEKDKYCPIFEASEGMCTPAKFMNEKLFIHDDYKRGFIIKIDGFECHRPNLITNPEDTILIHSEALINAKEIHCIDSSFLHLVECLPTTGDLFYHKYARPHSPDYKYLYKNWQVIS